MTLIEHFQELRSRLFKASVGIVVGLGVGLYFSGPAVDFINAPYCAATRLQQCSFSGSSPLSLFMISLRVALYLGLMLSAPVWLYQLWAFIAPGLHRHERRYTYIFVAVATPLFVLGAALAYVALAKSMHLFVGSNPKYALIPDISGNFDLVTGIMLLFGAAFEFPLLVVMLNFVGLLSARRLLGWWRTAVFLMFVFAAVVTPTPDPFAMSFLAMAMAVLYFGAVGVAFLHDRRKERARLYADLDDDELSPMDDDLQPVETSSGLSAADFIETPSAEPVGRAKPLDPRYDEMT